MKKLDLSKPIVSRGGHPVRIICSDKVGSAPIVALHHRENDVEQINTHRLDGKYLAELDTEYDLINAPVREERWVIFRKDEVVGYPHKDKCEVFALTNFNIGAVLHYVLIDGIPSEPKFIKPEDIK